MAYKNASVAAAGTLTQDVTVHGGTYLSVIAAVGPTAAAAADVSVRVEPYDDNPGTAGPALAPIGVPLAATAPANTLVAGVAYATAVYLVAGYTKVRITATNNNAGTQPVAISFDFKRA